MIKPYTSLFQERILGNKATVYHRTRINDLIKKVYTSGFRPGYGDFYGRGFYSTFELESQLNPSMEERYGNVIVKFVVTSLYNFFIYEWDEFIKTSVYDRIKNYFKNEKITKENFILKQYEFYFDRKKLSKNIIKDLKGYNKKLSLKKIYSSEIALYLYEKLNPKIYESNIDGIIFEGQTDGKVLACYNVNLLKPIEYTDDEGVTWKKVNDINKEIIDQYNKKVLDSTSSSFYKNIKNVIMPKDFWFLNIVEKYKIPKENYKITNKIYNIPYVIWKKGVWDYSEPWHDGDWRYGTWETGTWLDGIWYDGIWERGIWENGTWKNGIWYDGLWIRGRWEKGIWKDGFWSYGRWKKGIWEKGTWKSGTWEKGTWLNGTWKFGFWEGGTWHKGIWEDGEWLKGTWKNGIWKGGEWKNGTWKNGIWEGGFWRDGVWEKGWIHDLVRKGNFEPSWKWKDGYVLSPVSPKEYFRY